MDQNKPTTTPTAPTAPAVDKTNPNAGNNANAPGTWANDTKAGDAAMAANIRQPMTNVSNDPTAPFAADPLNAGISRTDATTESPDLLNMEAGGTGTLIVGGILVQTDYNADLSGRERIDIYDKMRKSDATVRLGLSAVKHPLLSAGWYIKPGAGEDDTGEKKTFVEEELFQNPNFSFTQFLRQALLFCDFGNSIFEKVFRVRADGKRGWKKFAPRLPKTIYKYTMEDGVTPGVTQYLPTGGTVEIPQWKLLTFILDIEGSNYEGQSLLRAAYQHWYYKDLYYRIDSIASERQGMGVPIISVPNQALEKDKAKAQEIARNMRVNQEAYVNLPAGFKFEYVDTHATTLKNVEAMVLHHDRQILKAFLAQFLDMGSGQSAGTKGLSDDQSELFLVAEQYFAKIIQEGMNLAIREVVALNYSGLKQDEYPTLEYGSIGQIDFLKLAQALGQLTTAGVVVPDGDLERYVRVAMSLPEAMDPELMDEDDLQRRKVMQQPTMVDENGAPVIAPGTPQPPKNDPKKKGSVPTNKMGKVVNNERQQRAYTFAEDLLSMKAEVEAAIELKEHAS